MHVLLSLGDDLVRHCQQVTRTQTAALLAALVRARLHLVDRVREKHAQQGRARRQAGATQGSVRHDLRTTRHTNAARQSQSSGVREQLLHRTRFALDGHVRENAASPVQILADAIDVRTDHLVVDGRRIGFGQVDRLDSSAFGESPDAAATVVVERSIAQENGAHGHASGTRRQSAT